MTFSDIDQSQVHFFLYCTLTPTEAVECFTTKDTKHLTSNDQTANCSDSSYSRTSQHIWALEDVEQSVYSSGNRWFNHNPCSQHFKVPLGKILNPRLPPREELSV